jgi:N-carbamoylputrescine amidase
MKRIVRAAVTETINAFGEMPERVEDLADLSERLDELRDANLEHHAELAACAAAVGVQILCMGELFAGPYFALHTDRMWWKLAEDSESGPSVTAMKEVARECGIILIAPIYELDGRSGRRFNTALFIDEEGEVVGKYRKVHIPNGSNEQNAFSEAFYYDRSDGDNGTFGANVSKNRFYPVIQTSIGRVGVSICYDRHFPYTMQLLAQNGAELVFAPSVTFGQKSQRMWPLEFPVDAVRHNLFIGGSNRRGSEAPWNQPFYGESYFVGPNGQCASIEAPEGLVVADLPLHELDEPDPSGWDLPRDSRPEIA